MSPNNNVGPPPFFDKIKLYTSVPIDDLSQYPAWKQNLYIGAASSKYGIDKGYFGLARSQQYAKSVHAHFTTQLSLTVAAMPKTASEDAQNKIHDILVGLNNSVGVFFEAFVDGIKALKTDESIKDDPSKWKSKIIDLNDTLKTNLSGKIDTATDKAIEVIESLDESEQDDAADKFMDGLDAVNDLINLAIMEASKALDNVYNFLTDNWHQLQRSQSNLKAFVSAGVQILKFILPLVLVVRPVDPNEEAGDTTLEGNVKRFIQESVRAAFVDALDTTIFKATKPESINELTGIKNNLEASKLEDPTEYVDLAVKNLTDALKVPLVSSE